MEPPPILILLINLLLFSALQCKAFTPPTEPHVHWSNLYSSSSVEDNVTTLDVLSLDTIRADLGREEETLIFSLIERAQFRHNDIVYKVDGMPGLGVPAGSLYFDSAEELELSFLEYMLIGTEVLHSMVRRYESPQEHAFFPSRLPGTKETLAKLDYPRLLSRRSEVNNVNLNWNKIVYDKYINVIVPAICAKGDDEQYGSTITRDIAILQAFSKRIHFGKFVAESKYQSDPQKYQQLVEDGDADGVMALLTNATVEEKLLTRAKLKATTYGREPLLSSLPNVDGEEEDQTTAIIAAAAAAAVVAAVEAMTKREDNADTKGKMDPAIIETIYRDLIIPMTKDIEVAYLFLRCGKEPPVKYAPDRMSVDVTELSPN